MAGHLIPEEAWQAIEPLLPRRPLHPKGGRPVIADRDVLTGIIFLLKTGIAWEDLPTEMGCGCGMTCLRRLREWQRAGVWPQVQHLLQAHLRDSQRIDWSRVRMRPVPRPMPERPDLFATIGPGTIAAHVPDVGGPDSNAVPSQPDSATLLASPQHWIRRDRQETRTRT